MHIQTKCSCHSIGNLYNIKQMGRGKNIILVLMVSVLIAFAVPVKGEVTATYLYNLADFTGTVPLSSVRINLDEVQKEVYVISGDIIRVFNSKGMEIHRFGENLDIGIFFDAAADAEGNIYVLSYKDLHPVITLCNYRGDPIREVTITKLPREFEGFSPNRVLYRAGTLYFASESAMEVVITDANGVFKDGMDLIPLLGIKEEKRADHGIAGFNVDREGNLLFTTPVTASAYVISPDRKVQSFGKRGSGPGRFGVPSGMARNRSGYYFVSDVLRCVVMIFNKDFQFITEFGYRGLRPGNLIGPREIVVDEDSRLYVTQLRDRGISVFKLENN